MDEKNLFSNNLFEAKEELETLRPKVTNDEEESVTEQNTETEEVLEVIEGEVIDVKDEDPQDFLDAAEVIEEKNKESEPIDIDLNQLMEIDDNQIIVKQDAQIQFNNYEDVLANVDDYLSQYKGLTFTDEQIKDAKKVRATLNKNKTKLNKMRVAVKKQVMKPLETLEDQVKTIINKIDEVNDNVDNQIKDFEMREQAVKGEKIQAFYNQCKEKYTEVANHKIISLNSIGKKEWGNKSYKLKDIKEEIKQAFDDVNNALSIIANLPNAARVLKFYKQNGFNLAEAQESAIHEANEEKINQATIEAKQEAKGVVEVSEEKIQEVREQARQEVKQEETVTEEEQKVRVKFEMVGTLPNIMKVINFMKEMNNADLIKVRELKDNEGDK